MTTQTPDALAALAWHGGFTPLAGKRAYFGRYTAQDKFGREEVQALIEQGYAETEAPGETLAAVFPTRAGLEEAARRSPPKTKAEDRVRAVLGSRNWEVRVNNGCALVGLFLTETSAALLAADLIGALDDDLSHPGVLIETIGGSIPPELAAEITGEAIAGAPDLELAPVPEGLVKLVGLGRHYRFMVDVRRRENTVTLFQWVGPNPRLLSSLPLPSLVEALKATHPNAADHDVLTELEAMVNETEDETEAEAAS